MPRKLEKPKSNSIHAQTSAARENDNSVLSVPEIAGCELLNETGRTFYGNLFRSDPSKWSAADLYLIHEAAMIHQELHAARMIAIMTAPIATATNGVRMRAPEHTHVADLSKRLGDTLRHLGARGRDGAKPPAAAPVTPVTTDADNIASFEDFVAAIK